MPNQFELNTIRNIIKKYYSPYLLTMFDKIVEINYELLKKKGLLILQENIHLSKIVVINYIFKI